MTNENLPPTPDTTETTSPEPEPKVIAGFWKRLLAFIIDGLLLGVVGFLLGLVFFDAFARLGGWGRLIGFIIALLYFGVLNSSIGKGQTIGKRITNIKVVDHDGQLLPLSKSFLRYTILALPFFLNGALIPPSLMMSALGIIIGLIIFGISGAIIYLYIFNRRTRQSLHDLAVGSFVVRASALESPAPMRLWKYHYLIAGIWCLIILIFAAIISPMIQRRGVFPELLTLHNSIQNSGKVHMASVFVGTSWGANGETQYLTTNAIWKNKPASPEVAASEIASIILREYPDITNKDILAVTITYGFDIGIASGWQSYNEYHSPAERRQKLQQ